MGKFKMKGISMDGDNTLNIKSGKLVNTPYSKFEMPEIEMNSDPNYRDHRYDYQEWVGDRDTNIAHGDVPGENVSSAYRESKKRGNLFYRPIGQGDKEQSNAHEEYTGVKDASAGYGKYELGMQNAQERADQERFSEDLSKNLQNYNSKLAIQDMEINEENFNIWKQLSNKEEGGGMNTKRELWKQFENEAIESANLHNELKLAAEKGYKPDSKHNLDYQYEEGGEYGHFNEGLAEVHKENAIQRKHATAEARSDDEYDHLEQWLAKNPQEDWKKGTNRVEEWAKSYPWKARKVKGLSANEEKQWDTDGANKFEQLRVDNMGKKDRKKYDKEQQAIADKEAQHQADILANLPGAGTEDEIAAVDAETKRINTDM